MLSKNELKARLLEKRANYGQQEQYGAQQQGQMPSRTSRAKKALGVGATALTVKGLADNYVADKHKAAVAGRAAKVGRQATSDAAGKGAGFIKKRFTGFTAKRQYTKSQGPAPTAFSATKKSVRGAASNALSKTKKMFGGGSAGYSSRPAAPYSAGRSTDRVAKAAPAAAKTISKMAPAAAKAGGRMAQSVASGRAGKFLRRMRFTNRGK